MGAMRDKLRLIASRTDKALYGRGLRRASRLALPEFLGIGAQKCGTTWLHENLARHPGLFLPPEKELHYFDWHFSGSLKSYSRHFFPGVGRIKGEITPNYCTLAAARIAFIRAILPRLRLVFLMRNPIDRAWSQAVMNLVERPGRDPADVPDSEFLRHFRDPRSVRRGEYLANLERWECFFPAEQIFCGFYESISANGQGLLGKVFRFLGVSAEVDWDRFPHATIVRPGAGVPLPERFRKVLQSLYRDDIEQLYERFGPAVASWRV